MQTKERERHDTADGTKLIKHGQQSTSTLFGFRLDTPHLYYTSLGRLAPPLLKLSYQRKTVVPTARIPAHSIQLNVRTTDLPSRQEAEHSL